MDYGADCARRPEWRSAHRAGGSSHSGDFTGMDDRNSSKISQYDQRNFAIQATTAEGVDRS